MIMAPIRIPLALSIVMALGTISCGGGGTDHRASSDDLPRMVLQLEDVPDGFKQTDRDGRIDLAGEGGIQANLIAFMQTGEGDGGQIRFSEFELAAESAADPGVLCIASFADAADNPDLAQLGWFNLAEFIIAVGDDPAAREVGIEIEALEVPAFPGAVWRFRSPSEDLCMGWKNEPVDGYIFSFVMGNTAGAIFVSSAEGQGDLDSAVAVASKQVDRVQRAVTGDS